jgi:hypothetical protein
MAGGVFAPMANVRVSYNCTRCRKSPIIDPELLEAKVQTET